MLTRRRAADSKFVHRLPAWVKNKLGKSFSYIRSYALPHFHFCIFFVLFFAICLLLLHFLVFCALHCHGREILDGEFIFLTHAVALVEMFF